MNKSSLVTGVFSFGSNSSAQLRARVKNDNLTIVPARVQDMMRIFCLSSKTWQSSGASLHPCVGALTYGAYVELTDGEIELLNKFETGYSKQEIIVELYSASTGLWIPSKALAYIADNHEWTYEPSDQYLTAIQVNLREQFKAIDCNLHSNIQVSGVNSDGTHRASYTWTYPGIGKLGMPSFLVELNAHKSKKSVMPQSMVDWTAKLAAIGILTVEQLRHKLSQGDMGIFDDIFSRDELDVCVKLLDLSDNPLASIPCSTPIASGSSTGTTTTTTPTTTRVFSFGSNSMSQLRARVKNPNLTALPARVHNTARIFCLHSPNWSGGVASLHPHEGCVTYGAVVDLSSEELERLHAFEGGYRLQPFDIEFIPSPQSSTKRAAVGDVNHTTTRTTRTEVDDCAAQQSKEWEWTPGKAVAYVAINSSFQLPPSEEYLTAIHVMLREQFGATHPELCDTIDINAARESLPPVASRTTAGGGTERLSVWRYPAVENLTLRALLVEINANRQEKWTMPRSLVEIAKSFTENTNNLNIHTTAELRSWLMSASCSERADKRLSILFDSEALEIARKLLKIEC